MVGEEMEAEVREVIRAKRCGVTRYRVAWEWGCGLPTDVQYLPLARSFAGRISRHVVHHPVSTVSTKGSAIRSARIS